MKTILTLISVIFFGAELLAQSSLDYLNPDQHRAWRIMYEPYKQRAIDYIQEHRKLSGGNIEPAYFSDDIIVVQDRFTRGIDRVYYGNKDKGFKMISPEKVYVVFSKVFVDQYLLQREEYYYRDFPVTAINFGQFMYTQDYLNNTTWGTVSKNELVTAPTRMTVGEIGDNFKLALYYGDEEAGLPLWMGGFFRAGFLHPNFKVGVQYPMASPLPGKWLKGGIGGYGGLNIEGIRISIAAAQRDTKDGKTFGDLTNYDTLMTIGNKKIYQYSFANLTMGASYAWVRWSIPFGIIRFHIGGQYVKISTVTDSSGVSLGKVSKDLGSPSIRFEYASYTSNNQNPPMEAYIQGTIYSLSGSFIYNMNGGIGLGLFAHLNLTKDFTPETMPVIMPVIRFRF